MTETLSNWSNTSLYIAIVLYAAAFIFFTFDLATRGSKKQDAVAKSSAAGATSRAKSLVGAGAGAAGPGAGSAGVGVAGSETDAAGPGAAGSGASGAGLAGSAAGSGSASSVISSAADAGIISSSSATSSGSAGATAKSGKSGLGNAVSGKTKAHEPRWRDQRGTVWLRVAMILTVVAYVAHLAATLARGIAAERVPWSNMFEYSMTSSLLIVTVFLGVQFWNDLRFLGTFIAGFTVLTLGVATVGFYVDVVPLQPALQSWWLVIHVFVASLGTGFLALGFGLSLLQLLQQRRETKIRAGEAKRGGWLAAMPNSKRLEDLAFRVNVIGFIFWTFTLVAGAIWAERAWGRYWGWDTKEVWTFIIWVVYAGYLHARGTRGWRGTPSAWLSMVGFATVVFNFGIVNVFFDGLHAYSGL